MTNIRDFHLYSNFLFVLHDKDTGVNIGCSNITLLARKSGISYGKLRYAFSTQGEDKYENNRCIILRLSTAMIFKGDHRVQSKGRQFKTN